MYRTHTCGELTLKNSGQTVTLSGWIQKSRDLGGMTFIDLRDRYGITQLVFNMETNSELCEQARKLGREFVIMVTGKVTERSNKNPKIPTGDIEIIVEKLKVLNSSVLPPFTIEDNTDGGDELRMQYRYLDLRRNAVKKNIELRHRMAQEIRKYLSGEQFLEIETPVLIKSTPEGARDFVVPSRMNARRLSDQEAAEIVGPGDGRRQANAGSRARSQTTAQAERQHVAALGRYQRSSSSSTTRRSVANRSGSHRLGRQQSANCSGVVSRMSGGRASGVARGCGVSPVRVSSSTGRPISSTGISRLRWMSTASALSGEM